MIPKILHFIWVGDESKEPIPLINSWRQHYPDFDIKVHRNDDLFNGDWQFKDDMMRFYDREEYTGVADLMRWEILQQYGGIALDADSLCIRRIPDWVLHTNFACAWDSNQKRDGLLLANGFLSSIAYHPLIEAIIAKLCKDGIIFKKWHWGRWKFQNLAAWKTVGPKLITDIYKQGNYPITILPSHFFYPDSYARGEYSQGGAVYACQFWGSTHNLYDDLNRHIEEARKKYK